MWNFQYKHGDRPLEGFTIERAAGRGGFGEVYFAISDTGRQVALKAVQGYEQIELRGISQCMNLKNPHLVTIFDVRYNEQNRPFVIMEFVSGPSLRQLLDEAPAGLGTQKAAFFLREMGKGLSYLHDNGIVHRDLKPANVFYENGYVKIGDYGLSKLINPAQNSAQTVTVGTVHYMAPEIGAGKYDRSIDIYALGAVLYEMLTGMVPYNGASPSEVLLKHLSVDVDTTALPEPFGAVVKKAMAKDPAQRYQTVQEMVEAVFGAEHVRQSVSVFSPDQLSVIAAHTAARSLPKPGSGAAVATVGSMDPSPIAQGPAWGRWGRWADRVTDDLGNMGDRIVHLGVQAAGKTGSFSHTMVVDGAAADPLPRSQRKLLAVIAAVVVGLAAGLLNGDHRIAPALAGLFSGSAALGAALGILLAIRRISPQLTDDSPFVRQLATGGMATLGAMIFTLIFDGPFLASSHFSGTWLGIIVPLFCIKTTKWADPFRSQRVCFGRFALGAGFFGYLAARMFDGNGLLAAMTVGGTALIVQVLAAWTPDAQQFPQTVPAHGTPPVPRIPDVRGSSADPSQPPPLPTGAMIPPCYRVAHSFFRLAWLIAALVCFALGLAWLIAAGVDHSNRDFSQFVCGGIGGLVVSIIFLVQSQRKYIYGWWSYFGKPVVLIACVICILSSAGMISDHSMRDGELAMAVFMIIFPSVIFIAVLAIPGTRRPMNMPESARPATRPIHRKMRWNAPYYQPRGSLFPPISRLVSCFFIAALVLTLADALNIPEAISLGLPNPTLAHNLSTQTFADYPAWPELLLRLGTAAAIVLTLLCIACVSLLRRNSGVLHIFRGAFGTVLIIISAVVCGGSFHHSTWTIIADHVHQNHSAAAVAAFLDGFDNTVLIVSAVMFLFSTFIVSWPPRRLRVEPTQKAETA